MTPKLKKKRLMVCKSKHFQGQVIKIKDICICWHFFSYRNVKHSITKHLESFVLPKCRTLWMHLPKTLPPLPFRNEMFSLLAVITIKNVECFKMFGDLKSNFLMLITLHHSFTLFQICKSRLLDGGFWSFAFIAENLTLQQIHFGRSVHL